MTHHSLAVKVGANLLVLVDSHESVRYGKWRLDSFLLSPRPFPSHSLFTSLPAADRPLRLRQSSRAKSSAAISVTR